jgi:hypothetical protein
MRVAIAGSMVLAVASMTVGKAVAETSPQLTPDEQSLVLLAIRTELTSHPNGWTSRITLCLSIMTQKEDEAPRQAQVAPEMLRILNDHDRKVVPFDRCVTRESKDRDGNREIRLRDATNGSPAYLLQVEVSGVPEGSGSASVEVTLMETECAPFSCDISDFYAAKKTKQGWAIKYKGRGYD